MNTHTLTEFDQFFCDNYLLFFDWMLFTLHSCSFVYVESIWIPDNYHLTSKPAIFMYDFVKIGLHDFLTPCATVCQGFWPHVLEYVKGSDPMCYSMSRVLTPRATVCEGFFA